jgi:hypothetical protein
MSVIFGTFFFKLLKVAHKFVLHFPQYNLCLNFGKKWVGQHFGWFIHYVTHLITLDGIEALHPYSEFLQTEHLVLCMYLPTNSFTLLTL